MVVCRYHCVMRVIGGGEMVVGVLARKLLYGLINERVSGACRAFWPDSLPAAVSCRFGAFVAGAKMFFIHVKRHEK